MNVRPWRDAQVPITKKDLLAQKKGQVRSTGGAMGSLEEEGYELQTHISKFCCHKILLSKCQVRAPPQIIFHGWSHTY